MILSQIDSLTPKGIPGILAYFNDDIEAAIMDTYMITGLEFGKDLIIEERTEGTDEDSLRRAIEEETDILKERTDINNSTSDAVGNVMQKGVAEGWTTSQLQQAILDLGVFEPSRALRIARTITGAGASQGQWLSGKMVGASHKTWSTAGDLNVRKLHQKLDGEKVGIDEKFSNGGRYPLDPLLSAAERVNCRCALLFERSTADIPVEQEWEFGAQAPPEDPMMKAKDIISCCDKPFMKDWLPDEGRSFDWEERAKELKRDSCKGFRRTIDGEWIMEDGAPLTRELQKQLDEMHIPPGWFNVSVTNDPLAEMIAVGQDSKGRWKYLYTEEYYEKKKIEKFVRVRKFTNDMDMIKTNIDNGIANGDVEAFLLRLEDKTGIRVGSLVDTKADVQAYGLTTLEGRHVAISGDGIFMDFIAKEGIRAEYQLTDEILAKFLDERLAITARNEMLFPDVTEKTINRYLKKMSDGANYTMKDYRTYNATQIAHTELQKYAGKVYTDKEKEKIIKAVNKEVSDFLHNTPAMAQKSYIDPMVWDIIGGLPV